MQLTIRQLGFAAPILRTSDRLKASEAKRPLTHTSPAALDQGGRSIVGSKVLWVRLALTKTCPEESSLQSLRTATML